MRQGSHNQRGGPYNKPPGGGKQFHSRGQSGAQGHQGMSGIPM